MTAHPARYVGDGSRRRPIGPKLHARDFRAVRSIVRGVAVSAVFWGCVFAALIWGGR